MEPDEIRELIESGLDCAHVEVTGDGRHFDAVVVSEAFAGKPMIGRHRLVYKTLGARFENDVLHALALRTYTPEQWGRLGR